MPPKLDQYLRRRETTMLQIIAILTFADDTANVDLVSLKMRVDNLLRLMKTFSETEDELFSKDPDNVSLAIECDEIYYSTMTKLNTKIQKIQGEQCIQNTSTTIYNTTASGNQPHSEIKLPRLTLPTFDGNYKEWQSFHDMFKSTVHDNLVLTGVQKLQYLKGAFKGEASASLRHLEVTEANYIEAYHKLIKRYTKRKLILSSFLKTFVNQPNITQTSAKHLRQVSDTSDEVIRGIKALGSGAEGRDPWLIYLVIHKLDEDTQQRWSQESNDEDLPSWKSFIDFLNKRADSLEMCQTSYKNPKPLPATIAQSHTSTTKICPLCDTAHYLFECTKFKEMDVNARHDLIQKTNRCFNCLCDSHLVSRCRSKSSCFKCRKRHNTLLHLKFNHNNISSGNNTDKKFEPSYIKPDVPSETEKTLACLSPTAIPVYQAGPTTFNMGLLQTALVDVRGAGGILYTCRALLDSGSLVSFITESCVQKLGLKRRNRRTIVEGLSSTKVGTSRGVVNIEAYSRVMSNTSVNIEALILSKITSQQPQINIDDQHIEEFKHLNLANPGLNEPGEIEILIGCDHYLSLILSGHINSSKSKLIAQETILGWIVSGTLTEIKPLKVTSFCSSINIDKSLTKFWELEDFKSNIPYNPQEMYCEDHFLNNFSKTIDGRYIVALPFDSSAGILGESKSQAIRRLQSVERRLSRDSQLKQEYVQFMKEFERLGHMERIPANQLNIPWHKCYYIPHHSIYKESSTTTKLRVVFDASAKTKTGRSLNDILFVGPSIQQTLQQILLRFRFHRYVLTADLEKMFRQILVSQPHTDFQRIVWRDEPNDSIQEFRLLTVTYGTAPAPFLSTRVLKQISTDNIQQFPASASVIARDFYIDDLMTGADTIDQLTILKKEVSAIMKAAGFNLHKWLTNCPSNDEIVTDSSKIIEISKEFKYSKVLGVYWNTSSDYFTYQVSLNQNPTLTKRGMLSEASKLFDPQGWLAPITIFVKIIFQKTWAKCLDWDDLLPKDILDDWCKFRNQLKLIESITIPRWLKFTSKPITLHGFSDASQNAYAAVVYAACVNEKGEIDVTIVSAKTKVAPVQKQITIPKLELCAALLLANLMDSVLELLTDRETTIFMWTDSSIVLSWLESVPRSLDVFTGNRISQIITNYPRRSWHHIATNHNPSDCASRGILPAELLHHNLWWTGPEWLKYQTSAWPTKYQIPIACNLLSSPSTSEIQNTNSQKTKSSRLPNLDPFLSQNGLLKVSNHKVTMENKLFTDMAFKYSHCSKFVRIVARLLQFIHNLKKLIKNEPKEYMLSVQDYKNASEKIIKWTQSESFETEIYSLCYQKPLPKCSKLVSLNPFLDEDGILRVGGRIQNANVQYDTKFPIILPAKHIVTELIINETHTKYLHASQSLMIATLRQRYWIINCKNLVRQQIHKCVTCTRYKAIKINQLMGELPPARVNFKYAFHQTGVDYAGPIWLKAMSGRKSIPQKAYIAFFVCLSSKAVHIELVTSLSTEAFIAALKRFMSRRGVSADMFSDNGTNFVGARNEFLEIQKPNKSKQHNQLISNFLLDFNTKWHFIPPYAPNFGGLWEAAVKSTKYHIKRVLGTTLLNFEEMSTLLVQIEASLNSRPICVLSPQEDALTPAHFIVGQPLTLLPEPDFRSIKQNRLSRWRLVQQMMQHIWSRRKFTTSNLASRKNC